MFHPIDVREFVVSEKLGGKSLLLISEEQSISYSSACRIWKLYKMGGINNLVTRYANCGLKRPKFYRIYRFCIRLKRLHPTWGAPFILTLLEKRYPKEGFPSVRTVQNWFKSKQITQPLTQRGEQESSVVRAVHDCWQIDAKENLKLKGGSTACYLTTVDVKSGGVLETPIFSLWTNQSG